MRKLIAMASLLLAALPQAACLDGEITHTLYLSPDGAVTWVSVEDDVRSDGEGAARAEEEEEYIASALAGTNEMANAFKALEADRVKTRVLRRERPFTVRTEARFSSAEAMADAILAAFRIPGDAYVTREDGAVTLHVHLDFRTEKGNAVDTPVGALVAELTAYRIVVTDGRFVEASGFTIDGNGRVAKPVALTDEEASGVVDVSLTWK
jgi:hypothetical protein